MSDELLSIQKSISDAHKNAHTEVIQLFPGIELSYFSVAADSFTACHSHEAADNTIQINYCRSGQLRWEMSGGSSIFLNPGDFSLHTMKSCADSVITFPSGEYSGLLIVIDINKAAANPPEVFCDTDIFKRLLDSALCRNDSVYFIPSSEHTEQIFDGFYSSIEYLKIQRCKVKLTELFIYLAELGFAPSDMLPSYKSDQIDTVKKVHDALTEQLRRRITITELSKQYLINPTTLKTAFKAVYGNSIAAHIKEHRMEEAAKMLRNSNMSIAAIAYAVGYDSQSKFTAAFKAFYHILPKEYRRTQS